MNHPAARMNPPRPTPDRDGPAPSDAELVRQARAGDKRAFVAIVSRYQATVCGIALGILGDFAASEDAGQEAFLSAWKRLNDLQDPTRLRAWLGQIARNAALRQLRGRRDHEALPEDPAVEDTQPAPDQSVASGEEAALVRAHLNRLPEKYRVPLVLYYREEQSVRTVAEALGISEDAVKQRLARGRELLRDQLSGVIETVLTRTGPSTAFTLAVAAALGALTPPTAVAAGVFTGSSAATTANPSLPFLGFMGLSKSALVTALIIAAVCIPVGRQIGARSAASSRAPVRIDLRGPVGAFSLADSAVMAEWKRLHELHGTGPEAMPRLYQAIAELDDPLRRSGFHTALVQEWVQVDPVGGLNFFLENDPESSEPYFFFAAWLANDPSAAVDTLLNGFPRMVNLARGSLLPIGQHAPARLAEVVGRLPDPPFPAAPYNLHQAFVTAAQTDLAMVRPTVEALRGPHRERVLAAVAESWARIDLAAALDWVRSLPEVTDRDELVRAALVGQAASDPAAALARIGDVPSGGNTQPFGSTAARVVRQAAEADFEATVAWLSAHPGQVSSRELGSLYGVVTQRLNEDPLGFLHQATADGSLSLLKPALANALLNEAAAQRPVVWEWLKSQPNTEEVNALRDTVLHSIAGQDSELALRLVADVPSTPTGDRQMRNLAHALLESDQSDFSIHRLDELLQKAPERLRGPLLESAFFTGHLNKDTLDDPKPWMAWLTQLPEGQHPQATASLVRAWAPDQPEEAAAWVATLAPGPTRTGALEALGSQWAAVDASGAMAWFASLPAGMDRDVVAQSLVTQLADHYPVQAWEWALSVNDDERKTLAASHVVRSMANHDPFTARRWIEEGPFTPEIQEELFERLPPLTAGPEQP